MALDKHGLIQRWIVPATPSRSGGRGVPYFVGYLPPDLLGVT